MIHDVALSIPLSVTLYANFGDVEERKRARTQI